DPALHGRRLPAGPPGPARAVGRAPAGVAAAQTRLSTAPDPSRVGTAPRLRPLRHRVLLRIGDRPGVTASAAPELRPGRRPAEGPPAAVEDCPVAHLRPDLLARPPRPARGAPAAVPVQDRE